VTLEVKLEMIFIQMRIDKRGIRDWQMPPMLYGERPMTY
jgi:hypothetical protein